MKSKVSINFRKIKSNLGNNYNILYRFGMNNICIGIVM